MGTLPMPLYRNAVDLIRANFEEISKGIKPQGIAIGSLTGRQKGDVNKPSRFRPKR